MNSVLDECCQLSLLLSDAIKFVYFTILIQENETHILTLSKDKLVLFCIYLCTDNNKWNKLKVIITQVI